MSRMNCTCSRGGNADTCECRDVLHVLEVTEAPYSLGKPRRYYAADYQECVVVDCDGKSYSVRDINFTRVFVEIA